MTAWIDRETKLIRKIFEGTPKGYAADSYFRITVTSEPQANPELDDSKFVFQVPDLQQR